ncbi:hypothetical protein BH23THE1_BH23THE1_00570 [soil metagenome]
MFTLAVSLPDETWCSDLLRNVRWNKGRVECPRCHCYDIKNEGWSVPFLLPKNTFASSVKGGSVTKQAVFHYSHTIEEMVPGILSVLCTMAWMDAQ